MDMRDIAMAVNPETSKNVDRVARRPVTGGMGGLGGLIDAPIELAKTAAAPALYAADRGLGALRSVGQNYPNIAHTFNAINQGVMAAQGEPYYQQNVDLNRARQEFLAAQADYYGSKDDASTRFRGAMDQIYAMQPDFDPTDPEDFQTAIPILMQMAGPEAAMEFVKSFDPAKRGENLRKARQDFVKEQDNMQMIHEAYRNVTAVGRGYVAPTTLITNFAKLIDPGSVVRGEEADRIIMSGGLGQEFAQRLLNLTKGGEMTPELRQSIIRESARLYNAQASDASRRRKGFEAYTSEMGFTPKQTRAAMGGYDAFAPVAQGRPGDVDRYEYRPDVPQEILSETNIPNADVLWDKEREGWALVHPDPSQPYGVRILEWED